MLVLVAAALLVIVKQPIGSFPAPHGADLTATAAAGTSSSPTAEAVTPTPERSATSLSASAGPCPPSGLSIPALGIDSSVVRIGLEPDGTLATPTDADKSKAGWYPTVLAGSQSGTVLMDGHTYHDNTALFKTSFKQSARVGMTMELTCVDRRTFTYRVSEIQLDLTPKTYPGFVDSRQLYALNGPPQLVMITCTDWDALHGVWRNRAVLIATPLS